MQLYEKNLGINDALNSFCNQLIPEAFAVLPLPSAGGFKLRSLNLIWKVHAASQDLDSARAGIAKVKRHLDSDKYESANGYEALDLQLASAFKSVLNKQSNLVIAPPKQSFELMTSTPLRGRQVMCVIINY